MMRCIWAFAFVVLWSSGFVGAALADQSGPTTTLAWRYLVTAALLLAITLIRRPTLSAGILLRQGLIGVLAHAAFLAGVFGASAVGVSAGTVALICSGQPMLVILAGWLGGQPRPGGRMLFGLGLGLVAVVLTVGLGSAGGVGMLLPVISLVALSAAALLEQRWPRGTDVVTALTVQVCIAAVLFAGYAAVCGELFAPVTSQLVIALAWLVVLSGIGGYASFLVCLRRLGAARTSSLLYLTPPVTALWSWAMFARPPTPGEVAGLLLGSLAVALIVTAGPPGAGQDTQTRSHGASTP